MIVSFATKENIRNNKLIIKTQQRFKRERRNDFTEEINNIALSSDGDKRIQSIDLIAGILSDKKINPIVTEIFIRGFLSLVFITQSYFAMPENIRPNSTHYFIMKIPNKRELQ